MAAPFPSLQVLAQFTPGTWTDITQYVRTVNITRPVSRQQGPLWQYQAGTASIVLKNGDGRFDPDNLAGPYTSSTGLQQVVWTQGPGQSGHWVAPRNLSGTTIKVEAWGPSSNGVNGAGGAGGEYAAELTYSVLPGVSYPVVTPAANSGLDSTFDGTGVVANGPAANSSTGGTGSTNSIHFNGGSGGAAGTGTPNAVGGGGGSSGGNASAGNNGQAGNSGGKGGAAPAGGYLGGDGAIDGFHPGGNGRGPGAAGGGLGTTTAYPGTPFSRTVTSKNGTGRGGQVRLTYFVTIPSAATVTQVLPRVPIQVLQTWPLTAAVPVTNPATFQTLATAATVSQNLATVNWTVTLAGTVGAPDANNFQLVLNNAGLPFGGFLATSVNAGSAGTYPQPAFQVPVPSGGGPFAVQVKGSTPTTGAIYSATVSVTYSLFTGTADSWQDAGLNNPNYTEVTLTATDGFKLLTGNTIPATSPQGAGEDTGARTGRILDWAGWPGDLRQVDAGDTTIAGATTMGSDALSMLQLTADTEIGEMYVRGDGYLVFRHRQGLLLDQRSVAPQAVFGDKPGTQTPQVSWRGDGVHGAIGVSAQNGTGLINPATPVAKQVWVWSSAPYVSGAQLVLNYYDSTLTLISSSSGTVTATGPVPVLLSASGTTPALTAFVNVQIQVQGTPASSVIFSAAGAAPVANDLNLPSTAPWTAMFATTTITATGTWAVIAGVPGELAFTGVGRANDDTTLANDVQITSGDTSFSGTLQEATDPVSAYVYGFETSWSRTDLLLPDNATALQYANWVLYLSKNSENRFDTLTINPLRDPAGLFPQVLGREVGDRIQVWRSPPGVAARVTKDVFIRGIQHDFDASGHTFTTTWTLQSAARYGNFLILGQTTSLLGSAALVY